MKRTLCLIVAAFVALALSGPRLFALEKRSVAVLLSGDMSPYRSALEGFKDGVKGGAYEAAYEEYSLPPAAGDAGLLRERILALQPDLIFAVGTPAALFARSHFPGTPVIFSMVLNPVENGVVASLAAPGGGIGGVCLNIPVETQFRTLKRVQPALRRVGMLYDRNAGAAILDEARRAAHAAGLELVSGPVTSEREISSALSRILSQADSLWAFPDPLIYNAATGQRIILATLQGRIPFMVFSKSFVKAGALMALECDYADIGRQAGEMAARVFGQGGMDAIGVEFPRRTVLVINTRTAETIGLTLPGDITAGAELVGNGRGDR